MKPIYTFFVAAALCIAGAFSVTATKPADSNVIHTATALKQLSPAAQTTQPLDPSVSFTLRPGTVPATAVVDGWHSLGMGTYTEDIMSAVIPNYEPQVYEVEIEQNLYDPNVYRAINVYKNWKNPDASKFAYDATKATPIVFHVIYGKYAYIDNFNTGIVYTNGGTSAPINVTTSVSSFIGGFGLDYAYEHVPSAFASFRFGELTQTRFNELDDNFHAMWNGSNYSTNLHDAFRITLPENPTEVESEWKAIGTGSYTDDLIASANYHISVSTFDVEVEQNLKDPTLYRLVNPYKNLAIPDSVSQYLSYDNHARYHMEFHVYNDGTGYIEDFNSGVYIYDYAYNVTSVAAAKVKELGLSNAKINFTNAFGKYDKNTRTLTIPYKYYYEGVYSPCLGIECEIGVYDDGANMHGAFSLTIPDGTNVPEPQPTEETWTLLSNEAFMFNSITPDLVSGSTGVPLKVSVEQSDLKRNRYRIVNPFKDWTPAGSLTVDSSKDYYLPFFVDEAKGTGYVGDFETGLTDGATVISVKSASTANPEKALGTFNSVNRTLSIPATFTIDGKQVASMTVGEKAVNTTGLFYITVPEDINGTNPNPQPQPGNWSSMGTGKYTDDIFASIFDAVSVSTMDVEIEEDLDTPGRYRIRNPYKNWNNPLPEYILADTNNEGLIEFYEKDGNVWFTTFSTGLTFDGSALRVHQQAGSMIANGERSYEELLSAAPEAFAIDKGGRITQSASFELSGQTYSSILVTVDSQTWNGNASGSMAIEMPGYDPDWRDPSVEWWPIGLGKYTDDLLPEMFYEGVEPSTFDVEVEINQWNNGVYRIVDPYKYWVNTYSDAIQPFTGEYMVIHAEDPNYVWIENFYLGLSNGNFKYYASSQIGTFLGWGYTISQIKKWYPGAFAKMVDNVITYEAGFEDGGNFYWNWSMGFGMDDQRPTIANKNGLFRIDLNVRKNDYNSISDVNATNGAETEYFDLQGRRVANPTTGVYIRRCGSEVGKVLIP